MTADHPTREERYAALRRTLDGHVLHASMNICLCGNWRAIADAGSLAEQHRAHVAAALVAADPAPDQPDAGRRVRAAFIAGANWQASGPYQTPALVADAAASYAAQPVRLTLDEAAMAPTVVEPHEFVGRSDRWCEVPGCDRPDRNPIHAAQPVPAPEVARGVVEALLPIRRYAESHAVTARARGRDDRDWLDLLILLDRIVRDALPADDGADCCRERTTAGGCNCKDDLP